MPEDKRDHRDEYCQQSFSNLHKLVPDSILVQRSLYNMQKLAPTPISPVAASTDNPPNKK